MNENLLDRKYNRYRRAEAKRIDYRGDIST